MHESQEAVPTGPFFVFFFDAADEKKVSKTTTTNKDYDHRTTPELVGYHDIYGGHRDVRLLSICKIKGSHD